MIKMFHRYSRSMILGLALILFGVFVFLQTKPDQHTSVVFMCKEGKSIAAKFNLTSDKGVDLILSDGRKLFVPRALSASGARYANVDETFVFWNKGNTAFITEGKDGKVTYDDCLIDGGVALR